MDIEELFATQIRESLADKLDLVEDRLLRIAEAPKTRRNGGNRQNSQQIESVRSQAKAATGGLLVRFEGVVVIEYASAIRAVDNYQPRAHGGKPRAAMPISAANR